MLYNFLHRKQETENVTMKMPLTTLAALIATSLWAKTTVFPRLASPLPPVCETTTNFAVNVSAAQLDTFSLSMEFLSCASNEVLIAIGEDANNDGDLSFDEAALAWGCDCGEWYCIDLPSGTVCDGPVGTLTIRRRHFNPEWNLVKAIRRGACDMEETITMDEKRVKFILFLR